MPPRRLRPRRRHRLRQPAPGRRGAPLGRPGKNQAHRPALEGQDARRFPLPADPRYPVAVEPPDRPEGLRTPLAATHGPFPPCADARPRTRLLFVVPVVLHCGPKRRKKGFLSALDSFMEVPKAWLSNQLGIDVVPVNLNLFATEIPPGGQPLPDAAGDSGGPGGGPPGRIRQARRIRRNNHGGAGALLYHGGRPAARLLRRRAEPDALDPAAVETESHDLTQGKATKKERAFWHEGFTKPRGIVRGDRGRRRTSAMPKRVIP